MQSMQRPFAVISYELQDSMGLPRNYKDSPGFSLDLRMLKGVNLINWHILFGVVRTQKVQEGSIVRAKKV